MREIYVSNVAYGATEDELQTFLEYHTYSGAISSCELRRDDGLRMAHKGFGFVTFVDERPAQRLCAFGSSLMFRDRYLRIKPSKRYVPANAVHGTVILLGDALSMGYITTESKHNSVFHSLWSTSARIETEIDFRERKLYIKFDHPLTGYNGDQQGTKLKLEFRFRNIACATRVKNSNNTAPTLLIEVREPPNIFESHHMGVAPPLPSEVQPVDVMQLIAMMQGTRLTGSNVRSWCRTVDFTSERSIAQSIAYIIDFQHSVLPFLNKALENFVVSSQFSTGAIKNLRHRVPEPPYADMTPEVLVPLMKCPEGINLPFHVMYRLDELVQTAVFSGSSLSRRFFALLSGLTEDEALSLLGILQRSAPQRCMIKADDWLEKHLRMVRSGALKLPNTPFIWPEPGFTRVYRVLISPTMIWCEPPELEVTNRVTRHYVDVISNFLRLSFIEEDGSNLSSQALLNGRSMNDSPVCRRVRKILSEGIHLHGKHFEFLAFSSSQLREQSVWMFARTGEFTAKGIRDWMGNFLRIRNVAKCAARMGQCFSSTTKTLTVDPADVTVIEDVWSDGHCFSVGIGRIRYDFAKKVAAKCGRLSSVPSAFQIRFGGFKGVVAVCDWAETALELRESMQKFESTHYDLEVVTWTKALPCYLNRQIITLLTTLDVDNGVFEAMQRREISTLENVLSNSGVALNLLHVTSSGSIHEIAKAMLQAGYHPSRELYLRSLLQAFRAIHLLQLRTKARILVSKGRTMMGCLDESGILDYGEVFVQVSRFPGSRNVIDDGLEYEEDGTCIVLGRIVVAKSVCILEIFGFSKEYMSRN